VSFVQNELILFAAIYMGLLTWGGGTRGAEGKVREELRLHLQGVQRCVLSWRNQGCFFVLSFVFLFIIYVFGLHPLKFIEVG
jgi:hypothetical protein